MPTAAWTQCTTAHERVASPTIHETRAMTASTQTTLELNGQPISVPSGTSIAELVAQTLPNARAYAVEVNRAVLSRRDHATRIIASGDRVEIVTLVGGG